MQEIKTFSQAYDFLVTAVPKTSTRVFKGEAGLAQSQLWMEKLGNPQDTYPAIHIAGTSGKGTVAHLISALLEAHSKKTALITSPHAYDICERIQANGKKISRTRLVKLINKILPTYKQMKRLGKSPSYFEVLMALGFMAAVDSEVDYCVVETGLGGKLDTSNTIRRDDKVCVLTPIGYDHMNILGNTISKIATQKAGIIHSGQMVFTSPQSKEAMSVIRAKSSKEKARLITVSNADPLRQYGLPLKLSGLNPQLSGQHNRLNVALALRVVEYIAKRDGWALSKPLIRKAIKDFSIPGRFEVVRFPDIGKEVVFDGAHNTQKMEALMGALKERYGSKKLGFVFASSKENPQDKLHIIKSRATTIVLTKYHSKELDILKPQPDLQKLIDDKDYTYIPDAKGVAAYIKSSRVDNWVVTGSFFVLGEIRKALSKMR